MNPRLSVVPASVEDRNPLDETIKSFVRHLRADNKSPRTIETYEESIGQFADFLKKQSMPLDFAITQRRHVEAFVTHLLETRKPATASIRFRALQQFFKWLADDEEISESPMKAMKPPIVPETLVPVISKEDMNKLLHSIEKSKDFEAKRDLALIIILYDSGARRDEIANLRYSEGSGPCDVNLDQGVALVMGKGRKERYISLGARTIKALDRYLRARGKNPNHAEPWLWVSSREVKRRDKRGDKGRLSANGILLMLGRRSQAALGRRIHPHQFRHSMVHEFLSAGGEERDLMRLTGWTSTALLNRYAASTGSERAIAAHKKFSPADNL